MIVNKTATKSRKFQLKTPIKNKRAKIENEFDLPHCTTYPIYYEYIPSKKYLLYSNINSSMGITRRRGRQQMQFWGMI